MRIFENFFNLTWGQRVTILLLVVALVQNTRASMLKLIKGEWRFIYIYGTVTIAALVGYAVLLLAGVLHRGEYAQAVQWLSPLIVMRLILTPSLHIWEEQAIRSLTDGVDGTRPSNFRHRKRHYRHWLDFHKAEGKKRGKPNLSPGGSGS